MPLSTHLSSDPEMFQAMASQRNLTPSKPVHSSKQKQQRLSKPNPGQIFPSLGRNGTAHGASTNSLNPSSDPGLSLRARANQTNRSPQLAFAAAVIAASLQLFTLPGLAVEHQQNLTQPGGSSNTTNIISQQNDLLESLLQEVQKINKSSIWDAISSFISALGVLAMSFQIYQLNNKLQELAKSNDETKSTLGKSLMELGEVGKALTKK